MPDRSKGRSQINAVKLFQEWRPQVSTIQRKHKMSFDLRRSSYHITRRAGEHRSRLANVSWASDKKSTAENNGNNNNIDITSSASTLTKHQKARLLEGKKEVIIFSLNVQTLRNF